MTSRPDMHVQQEAGRAEKVLYGRPDSMLDAVTHYCAGCGHSTIHRIVAELVDEMDLRERTVGIAPIGCAVVAYNYIDIDWTEAAHGRPPAVATGLKRMLPDVLIFTYQGDGDLASIGMAETVHAANRGENFTIIFINNGVYGMTQGQMAPTTLVGQKTATTPTGRDPATEGHPIRMCELLDTLVAPALLARVTVTSPEAVREAKRMIRRAFRYQLDGAGFTFVEVLSPCPTYWRMSPADSLRHVDEEMVKVFPLGAIRDRPAEENTDG
jgi:2-oxoglutarate ferredoxin oxidoreductase subunit beta